MAAVQLSNVNGTLLPPTITEPIFQLAAEQSAVMQLARQVPLSVNATTAIPVMMDLPVAGWVSEGAMKPVGTEAVGVKTMQGKKVALLVPVSEELVRSNPSGLYDQLQRDLPSSISRAFDYAAIHGVDLKTGGAGPFGDYLAMTPNSQVIGATAGNAGGVYTDLWKGVQQVVNAPVSGYNFSGFAADPRLRPEVAMSVDANGRPFFVDNSYAAANASIQAGNLIGYPAYFNTGVSGKYYRQGDAVQTVTINGTPTGGTIAFTVGGSTFSAPYNATGSTVTTAAQAAGGAVLQGLTVTGSAGGPYTFTFAGASAPVIVSQKALTGGTAAASFATVTQSQADSGLRAIGGDWSQCAWGQGMDITIKVSTEANYYDGAVWHSAFQENLVLLLVEAYYGFIVNDPNAFVAYTHTAGS